MLSRPLQCDLDHTPGRPRELGIVVAGHNYGHGSSGEQGHEWRIDGLLAALRERTDELAAETPNGSVALELRLTRRERHILLASGLLAHTRESLVE